MVDIRENRHRRREFLYVEFCECSSSAREGVLLESDDVVKRFDNWIRTNLS